MKTMKRKLVIDLEELKIEQYTPGHKGVAKTSPDASLYYSGVICASSLPGEFADDQTKFEALLDRHESLLQAANMSLRTNAVAVCLYIPDMLKFTILNKFYAVRFGLRPPVRVCLQPTSRDDIGMGVFAVPNGTKVNNVHV